MARTRFLGQRHYSRWMACALCWCITWFRVENVELGVG